MSWQSGNIPPSPWARERDDDWEATRQERSEQLYGGHHGYHSPYRKPLTGSKTVWSGIAVMLMSVLSYFQGLDMIQAVPWLVCLCGAGIGLLMIILRFVTGAPVEPPNVVIKKMVRPGAPKR